ncbi:MAG: hypothetical protein IJZ20_03325 [Clostridia bacterium]|nr:hypothetical protein [Clostridia bacterium]
MFLQRKTCKEETAVKNNNTHVREPLFHVVKRDAIPVWKAMLFRVIAVAGGLLLCAVLSVFLIGANPLEFIETLFNGSFSSERRLWKFAKDAAVLLCIALAVTPAFRMRFWNIGAEGQVLIGALAAVAVAFYMGNSVPNWALLIIMFVSAVVVGAVWGGIPAIFKANWNTNETLFTLMMNYAASGIVAYFLVKWTPSGSSVLGELKVGHLPQIAHPYLLIILAVLVITVLVFIYQSFTKQGYEISVVGESENTARYIGINVKKVIIRTLDIGADKQCDYFNMPKEENPALGVRAIRLCLSNPQVFRVQLRALLRASAFGKLGIMFPMIANVWELERILQICEEIKSELKDENIEYSELTELGIMIETPAAALVSHRLAPMVDFFSIGTNDLIQYTLACDRQNPNVEPFCDNHHEAFLRLIDITVQNAHHFVKWVGICGELAADTSLTQQFISMGVDELSVSPTFVLKVRAAVRKSRAKGKSE